ncbi:MAG: DinB family protein [Gemmatimonadaceae bacterium]
MRRSVAQCHFLMAMAQPILAGLDDSHLALKPQPESKTAGWLIGHLAVTGDFGRRLCGRVPLCPVEWRAAFNPGSQPSTERTSYPPMATLQDAFRAVYADLAAAALNADPSTLAAINPFTPARAAYPTAGDFVGYLLAGHLAYHLGQLSGWRAAAGLSPVQRSDSAA